MRKPIEATDQQNRDAGQTADRLLSRLMMDLSDEMDCHPVSAYSLILQCTLGIGHGLFGDDTKHLARHHFAFKLDGAEPNSELMGRLMVRMKDHFDLEMSEPEGSA